MQLQELKRLVEYEALSFLMATKYGNGWVLVAVKKGREDSVNTVDSALYLAKGGIRVFKTLDAVSKLVCSDLYNCKFTVC